jgi:hypothetical protein
MSLSPGFLDPGVALALNVLAATVTLRLGWVEAQRLGVKRWGPGLHAGVADALPGHHVGRARPRRRGHRHLPKRDVYLVTGGGEHPAA